MEKRENTQRAVDPQTHCLEQMVSSNCVHAATATSGRAYERECHQLDNRLNNSPTFQTYFPARTDYSPPTQKPIAPDIRTQMSGSTLPAVHKGFDREARLLGVTHKGTYTLVYIHRNVGWDVVISEYLRRLSE